MLSDALIEVKRPAYRPEAACFFAERSGALTIRGMKSIAEIRLANLLALIKEAGTQHALAERAETTPIYLSQVVNRIQDHKSGRPRELGTDMARRLEQAMGKPENWMDHDHAAAAGAILNEDEVTILNAYRMLPSAVARDIREAVLRAAVNNAGKSAQPARTPTVASDVAAEAAMHVAEILPRAKSVSTAARLKDAANAPGGQPPTKRRQRAK
jgi:hypothetical protein